MGDEVWTVVRAALLIMTLVAAGVMVASIIALYVKLSRGLPGPPAEGEDFAPPISILKPVCGAAPDLYENLATFARQEYPTFEILFGVQSPDDPVIPVLERLQAEFPDTDARTIRVIVHDREIGLNPKVNNLAGVLPEAAHDVVLISDDNVRVRPDYLRANVRLLADLEVGLVSNLIRGVGSRGVGSLLEALHLNTFVLANLCMLDLWLDEKVPIGKSVFFRRAEFAALGGLERFSGYLAEDYLMGEAYREAGQKVVMSPYLIDTWTGAWPLSRFINRHTRWAKLRWQIRRGGYLAETCCNLTGWALVTAAAAGFPPRAWLGLAAVYVLRVVGDALLNLRLGAPLPWASLPISPFKDLLVACLWPVPIISSRTRWRGTTYHIRRRSRIVPA